ncbi:MAG: class I SAM-dependent methyltransferase, partial [Bacillota bacterium]
TYPVREGIGIFLTPDLPRNDYWEASGSALLSYLEEHPDVEKRLMESPLEALNGADQFYRAGVLDLRGHYKEARELERLAFRSIYTPEYQAATQQQMAQLIELLQAHTGPIFDLASGRGGLALRMLEHLPNPVVMTDFSPRVLRENRRRMTALGLYDRVSLLAFDARRTPFRDGSVGLLTTYHGLGNIEQPGGLLRELRRAASGRFLAVSFFCPEDDPVNGDLLRQAGMEQMLFRHLALQNFAAAGWEVAIRSAIAARATPTPRSAIFPDATVDGFPVAETVLEFCLLDAG